MKLEFNTNEQDEIIAQYLNTEFEILNQRALQYEQGVATKTNFYLAILTAAAGGIVIAFTQSSLPVAFLLSATIIVLIFLLVLGSITLSQTLDMLATAIFLYRRTGRIRRWFLDYAPKLLPYFPFVVADDSPPYLIKRSKLRGIESALLLSNAALAGIIASTLFGITYYYGPLPFYFLYSWIPSVIMLVIGVSGFIIAFQLQTLYVVRFLHRWEEREKQEGWIHFPAQDQK